MLFLDTTFASAANTVFFDDFNISFEKTNKIYDINSSKCMNLMSGYSVLTSNHLSSVSYGQIFLIDGNKYSIKHLKHLFNNQRQQIDTYRIEYNLNDEMIVNIFQKESNINRQLLALAIKGSGTIDASKFSAIAATFIRGTAPMLSLFSDVHMTTKDERHIVLSTILRGNSFTDSEIIDFYENYYKKVGAIEPSEQRQIFEYVSSDSSLVSFLNMATKHTDDFLLNPIFYTKKISSDSSIVLSMRLLDGKAPSSEIALQLINQISSDSSKVQALTLLNQTIFDSIHLVSVLNNISSDYSKLSAIEVIHPYIISGEHVLAIIKDMSSSNSVVKAISYLKNAQFSSDQIGSIINSISSDSSKVNAIEHLNSHIKEVSTAKSLLDNISSDSSIVQAVKIIFKNKRIPITETDIKTISNTCIGKTSILTIQNFLLENL